MSTSTALIPVGRRNNPYFLEPNDYRRIWLERYDRGGWDIKRCPMLITPPATHPLFYQIKEVNQEETRALQSAMVRYLAEQLLIANPAADCRPFLIGGSLAVEAHSDQLRNSGEPYINHPLRMAYEALQVIADPWLAILILLHDGEEDVWGSSAEAVVLDAFRHYPLRARELVEAIHAVSKIRREKALTIRRICLGSRDNVMVSAAKIVDCCDNQLDWLAVKEEKRIEKSTRARDVFAPIAWRLGFWKWRCILEDTAMRDLEPEIYWPLYDQRQKLSLELSAETRGIKQAIGDALIAKGLSAKIYHRPRCVRDIYIASRNKRGENPPRISPVDWLSFAVVPYSMNEEVEGFAFWRISRTPGFRHIQRTYRDYIDVPGGPFHNAIHGDFEFGGQHVRLKIFNPWRYRRAMCGVAADALVDHDWHKKGGGFFAEVERQAVLSSVDRDAYPSLVASVGGGIEIVGLNGKVLTIPLGDKGELPTLLDAAAVMRSDLPSQISKGSGMRNKGVDQAYVLGERFDLDTPLTRHRTAPHFTASTSPVYDAERFWLCTSERTRKALRSGYRSFDTPEKRQILLDGGKEVLAKRLLLLLLKPEDLDGCLVVDLFLVHFWQYGLDDTLRTQALSLSFPDVAAAFPTPCSKIAWGGPDAAEIAGIKGKATLQEIYYLTSLGYINPTDFIESLIVFRKKMLHKIPEHKERIMYLEVTTREEPGVLGQLATRLGQLGLNIGPADKNRPGTTFKRKGNIFEKTTFVFPCCSKMGEAQVRAAAAEFKNLNFVVATDCELVVGKSALSRLVDLFKK